MDELNTLERAVLDKLFDGIHPALRNLRRQAEFAKVASRKLSGTGFFTSLELPAGFPAATVPSAKIRFGDVEATIPGLQHGAGFLVYVNDGTLKMLEGYCYDEKWPERVGIFELHYVDPSRQSVEKVFGPMP